MAAPFILSESSVTFRAVAGQYGQFGEKDSMYDDQKDFDEGGDTSKSSPKVKKTNVINSDDDDDDLSIGDTTLSNNVPAIIQMLEDDDIDLEIFDKPLKHRTPTTRGRGRKRGRGRGRGKNVAEPKIGNDNEDNEEVVRFTNGSFHNTELPIKKYEYDEDIFTAESSSSLEVVAEVHGEQTEPIIVDTATVPVNELSPATNDDALIVQYQDKLYLVDPAPKPEQPVILVNEGGNLNGVFLNAKMEHDGIIYEVDEKKTSNKDGNNEVRNEPYTLINLSSGYTHKGSVSEGEEKVCSVKPLVVKEKGCRTDSKLEQFGVIKYKINSKDDTAVTKAMEDGKKNETPPHDAPASVTKNDTPVTKPTEPAFVMNDDDSPVMTPMEPASVMKDNTPVTKPTDAEKNGAPVMSSPTATTPGNELDPVDVNIFVPRGIKLYYCSDCTETFWMERGLEIHSATHAHGIHKELNKEREEYEEQRKQFVEALRKNEECNKSSSSEEDTLQFKTRNEVATDKDESQMNKKEDNESHSETDGYEESQKKLQKESTEEKEPSESKSETTKESKEVATDKDKSQMNKKEDNEDIQNESHSETDSYEDESQKKLQESTEDEPSELKPETTKESEEKEQNKNGDRDNEDDETKLNGDNENTKLSGDGPVMNSHETKESDKKQDRDRNNEDGETKLNPEESNTKQNRDRDTEDDEMKPNRDGDKEDTKLCSDGPVTKSHESEQKEKNRDNEFQGDEIKVNTEESVKNEMKESKEKEQNRYRDIEGDEIKVNPEESVKNEMKESEEKEQKADRDNEDNPEESVKNETKESEEKEQKADRDNEDNPEESVKNETKESEEKERKTDRDNEHNEDSEKVHKNKPDEESDVSGSKAEMKEDGVKSKLTAGTSMKKTMLPSLNWQKYQILILNHK